VVKVYQNIHNSDSWGSGGAEILAVSVRTAEGGSKQQFYGGETVFLKIDAISHKKICRPIIGFFLKDRLGQSLFGEHTFNYINEEFIVDSGQTVSAEFIFTLPLLPNGDYSITVSIAEGNPHSPTQHHWLHDAIILKVFSEKLRYGLVGIPFASVIVSK
jgi:lipopolysaccharide transport system ATP-binding protein